MVDLTPKLSKLPTAEQELQLGIGQTVMGEKVGGLTMYSDSFKRGYGDKIFGSDNNGIWLGAADFDDAPFSVDMDGNIAATSLDLSTYVSKDGTNEQVTGTIRLGTGTGAASIILDGANKRIIINDGTNDRVLLGYQSGGF